MAERTPVISALCAGKKEFLFFIKRVLKETGMVLENSKLKNDLTQIRRELNFYEEISKALTSSLDLHDILAQNHGKSQRYDESGSVVHSPPR